MPRSVMPLEQRLMAKVRKQADGCWLFEGARYPNGYGAIGSGPRVDGRAYVMRAHRAMWILRKGAVPVGLEVCHKCDVRNCVRPSHLFLGTRRDNSHDAMRKGRLPIGEGHKNSKLTVRSARRIFRAHGTHEAIAWKFRVGRPTVTKIKNLILWRHVNDCRV